MTVKYVGGFAIFRSKVRPKVIRVEHPSVNLSSSYVRFRDKWWRASAHGIPSRVSASTLISCILDEFVSEETEESQVDEESFY